MKTYKEFSGQKEQIDELFGAGKAIGAVLGAIKNALVKPAPKAEKSSSGKLKGADKVT